MNNVRPKVFISYAWTSSDYQQSVADFVNRLRTDGVDTLFDKFNLKPGQNMHGFMQESVNNPEVTFVLILCNPEYKRKADNYEGGVGEEAQILSPELYANISSDRFVPIIFDPSGENECVPTFLKGRIYIDLSDGQKFEANYEGLLRHIFNKPAFHEARLGQMPDYLSDESSDYSRLRQYLSTLRKMPSTEIGRIKNLSLAFIEEYISVISEFLIDSEQFNLQWYLSKIDKMLIPRDISVSFLQELMNVNPAIALEFFEKTIEDVSALPGAYRVQHREHFDFHVWEFILISTHLFWKNGYYAEIRHYSTKTYFWAVDSEYARPEAFYEFRPTFREMTGLFNVENAQNNPYYSYAAEIVDKHQKPRGIDLKDMVFADILLMYTSTSTKQEWYPLLWPYAKNIGIMYGNIQSRDYCTRYQILFGLSSIEEFKTFIDQADNKLQSWFFHFGRCSFLISDEFSLDYIGRYP